MNPTGVFATLAATGGGSPPTYLVGCQPASLDEGIGLSPAVAAAVPVAASKVLQLAVRLASGVATGSSRRQEE
jgi:hydrogenase maturation protease